MVGRIVSFGLMAFVGCGGEPANVIDVECNRALDININCDSNNTYEQNNVANGGMLPECLTGPFSPQGAWIKSDWEHSAIPSFKIPSDGVFWLFSLDAVDLSEVVSIRVVISQHGTDNPTEPAALSIVAHNPDSGGSNFYSYIIDTPSIEKHDLILKSFVIKQEQQVYVALQAPQSPSPDSGLIISTTPLLYKSCP